MKTQKAKAKPKVVKNTKLISFGEDEEDDVPFIKPKGIVWPYIFRNEVFP